MNAIKYIADLLVVLALFSSALFAETQPNDFSEISVSEARIIASKVDGMGGAADAFIKAAMKAGRVEIMSICWEDNYLAALFGPMWESLPDDRFKDRMVSYYLRNSRVSWPDEGGNLLRTRSGIDGTVRRWIPPLRKYLPDLPMDYSVLATREKRLKLADEFDAAAGIPIETEPEAKRVWSPKGEMRPVGRTAPNEKVLRDTGQSTDVAIVTMREEGKTSVIGSVAVYSGVAIGILILATWLIRRGPAGK